VDVYILDGGIEKDHPIFENNFVKDFRLTSETPYTMKRDGTVCSVIDVQASTLTCDRVTRPVMGLQ
jgi:hypothetical protein